MNCKRCEHLMVHTKRTTLEKLGEVVVIQTVEHTNECPECGVFMRVVVPTTLTIRAERR